MIKTSRKQEILQALATMLETQPGARITTAALARQVGVSEAALYRHFPSKAKMLEGLIEFIEESLFSRISRIMTEEPTAQARCNKLLALMLSFAELNPGMARLMVGDALQGETDRLAVTNSSGLRSSGNPVAPDSERVGGHASPRPGTRNSRGRQSPAFRGGRQNQSIRPQ